MRGDGLIDSRRDVAPVMVGREAEYYAWVDMRRRCQDPKSRIYAAYGGRGISVCARWSESFEDFYSDLGPRPDGRSLGRIDNDGDYEPGNVRWESPKQQARNRRSTRHIAAFGEVKTAPEWLEDERCRVTNKYAIYERINRGWSPERAITTPPGPNGRRK